MVLLINCALGLNTPPVGTTQFVGCAIGGVSVGYVMKTIWPFYGALIAALMLVTYVPAFSLWLPSVVLGTDGRSGRLRRRALRVRLLPGFLVPQAQAGLGPGLQPGERDRLVALLAAAVVAAAHAVVRVQHGAQFFLQPVQLPQLGAGRGARVAVLDRVAHFGQPAGAARFVRSCWMPARRSASRRSSSSRSWPRWASVISGVSWVAIGPFCAGERRAGEPAVPGCYGSCVRSRPSRWLIRLTRLCVQER
jgi:hypothetical protein